jgi:hypothetical protein
MAKPKQVSVVPNLHFVLIVASLVITVLAMAIIPFAPRPEDRQFYQMVAGMSLAFLFGKASNSFGKPMHPFPPALPATQDDTLPDAQG